MCGADAANPATNPAANPAASRHPALRLRHGVTATTPSAATAAVVTKKQKFAHAVGQAGGAGVHPCAVQQRNATTALDVIADIRLTAKTGGRKFSRDEMNER